MSKRNVTRLKPAPVRRPANAAAKQRNGAMISTNTEPAFTFGIEEEYFVIDSVTRDLVQEVPRPVFNALRSAIGKGLSTEYMRSQIEIATPVLNSAEEASDILSKYRSSIGAVLEPYGLAPLAVATHPFTNWRDQRHTDKARYNDIAESLQGLGRRMLVNGLHVHIGIENEDDRIRVMNGLRACLPMILALSTSSPFWGGEKTGLKSYRVAINDATPRRGIPENFANWKDFQATVATMVRAGMIEDASHLWWDVRPSARFATVETRIADVCPRVEDSVAISQFIRCLARALWRKAVELEPLTRLSLVLINENRWLAERYGVAADYIDASSGSMRPFIEVLDELMDVLREDAEALGTQHSLNYLRTIITDGTSADRQLAVYENSIADGETSETALRRVVDQLLSETLASPGMFGLDRSGSLRAGDGLLPSLATDI